MTGMELLAAGGLLAALLTLIEITPLKLNPWSALARAIGRAVNAEVLRTLQDVQAQLLQTQTRLQAHMEASEEKQADAARLEILHFNNAFLRGIPHTEEEFIEILHVIDRYEAYCRTHPDYPNSRAVQAVTNIRRVYAERMLRR